MSGRTAAEREGLAMRSQLRREREAEREKTLRRVARDVLDGDLTCEEAARVYRFDPKRISAAIKALEATS